MSKSVSKHIAEYLAEDSSLGLTIGTDLFVDREAAKPDDTITVFNTSGKSPANTLSKQVYNYLAVQIRVRNTSNADAYTAIYEVIDYLNLKTNIIIDSMNYQLISLVNGPTLLDFDDNNRIRLVCNFTIQRIN